MAGVVELHVLNYWTGGLLSNRRKARQAEGEGLLSEASSTVSDRVIGVTVVVVFWSTPSILIDGVLGGQRLLLFTVELRSECWAVVRHWGYGRFRLL